MLPLVSPPIWRLRNKRRNSILMTRHYPDLGGASDWSCQVENLIQAMRGTTQIWLVTCHQYGISVLVSQTSFGGETSGGVTKCHFTGKPVVSSWNVGCFLRLMSRQRARMNITMYSDLLMDLSWKKVKTVVLKFVKVWATSKLIINDLLESASNPHKW